jgi:hypothetical protein
MDLKNIEHLSSERVRELFISLMTELEKDGNHYLDISKKSADSTLIRDHNASYGAALLTKFNRYSAILNVENVPDGWKEFYNEVLTNSVTLLDSNNYTVNSFPELLEYMSKNYKPPVKIDS